MSEFTPTSADNSVQPDPQAERRRRVWIVVGGLLLFAAGGAYFYYESDRYSGDDVSDEAFPNSMQNVGR